MDNTNKKKHRGKLGLYIGIFASVIITLFLFAFFNWGQNNSTTYQKTQEIEAFLTREHGDEVRVVILHFEKTWFNFEMHKDPEPFMRELITGPLLEYYLKQINNQDNDYWLIPGQIDIFGLKVVDYSEKSMKVIACLNQGTDKVTREGIITERYPIHQVVKLFILIRADGSWKFGNMIDMTDLKQALQDWDFLPQELKDISGEIDMLVYKNCYTEK